MDANMRVYSKISLTQAIWVALDVIVFLIFSAMFAMASDRFVDPGDGTVVDTKTGLMWAAKDNGRPINWPDARAYCQHYNGGGHIDWRMPTLAELANLHDLKWKNKRGYHVVKLIDTSAQSCWASETRGNKAARFNFAYGQVYWLRQVYSGPTRVIPVRGGK